jgi:hypothetical protein
VCVCELKNDLGLHIAVLTMNRSVRSMNIYMIQGSYLVPWLPVRLYFCCKRSFIPWDSSSESVFQGLLCGAFVVGCSGVHDVPWDWTVFMRPIMLNRSENHPIMSSRVEEDPRARKLEIVGVFG